MIKYLISGACALITAIALSVFNVDLFISGWISCMVYYLVIDIVDKDD